MPVPAKMPGPVFFSKGSRRGKLLPGEFDKVLSDFAQITETVLADRDRIGDIFLKELINKFFVITTILTS